MGEAAVRVRKLKAESLKAADTYNGTAKPGYRIAWAQMKVLEFIVGCIAVGKCWVSYDFVAQHVGCCPDTVRIAVRNCARAGLLTWTPSWHWNPEVGRVTQFPNTYRLSDGVPGSIPGRRKSHDTEIPEAPQDESKKEERTLREVMGGVLKRVRRSNFQKVMAKCYEPDALKPTPQLLANLATSRKPLPS